MLFEIPPHLVAVLSGLQAEAWFCQLPQILKQPRHGRGLAVDPVESAGLSDKIVFGFHGYCQLSNPVRHSQGWSSVFLSRRGVLLASGHARRVGHADDATAVEFLADSHALPQIITLVM